MDSHARQTSPANNSPLPLAAGGFASPPSPAYDTIAGRRSLVVGSGSSSSSSQSSSRLVSPSSRNALISPHTPDSAFHSSDSQQQLVLRGAELHAFTSALREMVRTNTVRASRQAALNETNSQLHAMNFFLHYCNSERSLKMQRSYDDIRDSIEEGRLMLNRMNEVMLSQENSLNQLGNEVAAMEQRAQEQQARVGGIEEALVEQKEQLTSSMREYEARLSLQEQEFRKQEAVLSRLLSVRFKLDFGLDVLLGLLAWYAAHNGLVGVMMQWIGQHILFRNMQGGRRMRNRYTRNATSVGQLLLFFLILRRFRRVAKEQGFHHSIGSYGKYAAFVAQTLGTTVAMVRGGGAEAIEMDDEAIQQHAEAAAAASASAASAAAPVAGAGVAPALVPGAGLNSLSPSPLRRGASSSVLSSSAPPSRSPDFSASAASSLGRSLGSAVLSTLRTTRDSIKFVLQRVVATGAPQPEEEEGNVRAAVASVLLSGSSAAPAVIPASSSSRRHSIVPGGADVQMEGAIREAAVDLAAVAAAPVPVTAAEPLAAAAHVHPSAPSPSSPHDAVGSDAHVLHEHAHAPPAFLFQPSAPPPPVGLEGAEHTRQR